MRFRHELNCMAEWVVTAWERHLACHADGLADGVHRKGQNDVVTDCDYAVEAFLLEKVRTHFPDDGFLSEERHRDTPLVGRTWVVDPIDGTVNFANGLALHGIQMALMEDRQPVASVIFLPGWKELYTAASGEGTFLNGRVVRARPADLRTAVVSLGDFSGSDSAFRCQQLHIVTALHDAARKVRMFGAACVDFASVATGRTNAHVMLCRNVWDYAPGHLLAREAGAFTNHESASSTPYIVCAASEGLLRELLDRIGPLESDSASGGTDG